MQPLFSRTVLKDHGFSIVRQFCTNFWPKTLEHSREMHHLFRCLLIHSEEMSANASTHCVVSISWEYPSSRLNMGFIYFDDDDDDDEEEEEEED